MYKAGILTVSDKGSRGEREDLSGQVIKDILNSIGVVIAITGIVPDEKEQIAKTLTDWVDVHKVDLILTTGGTGLSPRDVTPEATLAVVDKLAPGFGEAMRAESGKKVPTAMLSRAIAGVRKRSLIINMPGSPKAVRECLDVIIPALPHAIETVRGEAFECATQPHK
ncbi:MAG: molybdopterin adenylyltransferase [Chloroflexi bacterium]|nr:molybdopterin adenylyltransferase [Chloroflexota bacterium]